MTEWVNVASIDSFVPGSKAVVDVDGTDVAVFNLDGELHAIEDLCSHDHECLLCTEDAEGSIDGHEIICPAHGARFDIRTGKALTAPAYEDIAVLPTRVEEGMVQVRDDRWD